MAAITMLLRLVVPLPMTTATLLLGGKDPELRRHSGCRLAADESSFRLRPLPGDDLCDVSINNVAFLVLPSKPAGPRGRAGLHWKLWEVAALENSRFVAAMSGLDARVPCQGPRLQ